MKFKKTSTHLFIKQIIIVNGIKNGETNEEMKIKAQKIGWAI